MVCVVWLVLVWRYREQAQRTSHRRSLIRVVTGPLSVGSTMYCVVPTYVLNSSVTLVKMAAQPSAWVEFMGVRLLLGHNATRLPTCISVSEGGVEQLLDGPASRVIPPVCLVCWVARVVLQRVYENQIYNYASPPSKLTKS